MSQDLVDEKPFCSLLWGGSCGLQSASVSEFPGGTGLHQRLPGVTSLKLYSFPALSLVCSLPNTWWFHFQNKPFPPSRCLRRDVPEKWAGLGPLWASTFSQMAQLCAVIATVVKTETAWNFVWTFDVAIVFKCGRFLFYKYTSLWDLGKNKAKKYILLFSELKGTEKKWVEAQIGKRWLATNESFLVMVQGAQRGRSISFWWLQYSAEVYVCTAGWWTPHDPWTRQSLLLCLSDQAQAASCLFHCLSYQHGRRDLCNGSSCTGLRSFKASSYSQKRGKVWFWWFMFWNPQHSKYSLVWTNQEAELHRF